MVVNKERNIKRFKRILKELGIYTAYIRERKKYAPDGGVFSVAGRYSSLTAMSTASTHRLTGSITGDWN